MRFPVGSLLLLGLGLAGLGCGGGPDPSRCKIHVQGVQEWNLRTDALDVTYRVSGDAGSPGLVWLVANPKGPSPISGGGVDVGPGPFAADVSLKLTGAPREFWVVLELQDPTAVTPKRCKALAKPPSS